MDELILTSSHSAWPAQSTISPRNGPLYTIPEDILRHFVDLQSRHVFCGLGVLLKGTRES